MKIKTLAVTFKEGDYWKEFHEQKTIPPVYSILFEDGSIWDAFNGWRGETKTKKDLDEIRKIFKKKSGGHGR